MNREPSFRRALPFTFFVYGCEATLACFASLPGVIALDRQLTITPWDDSGRALFLERMTGLRSLFDALELQLVLAAIALVVLSPWLQASWLFAHRESVSLTAALVRGAGRTLPALRVSGLMAALFGLLASPCALLAYLLHLHLEGSANDRTHDLVVLGALGPLLPMALYLLCAHDLARAFCLKGAAWVSVRRGLSAARRLSVLSRYLSLSMAGAAIVCSSALCTWRLGHSYGAFALTVALLQAAALARLALRSVWLSTALACVDAEASAGPETPR